MNLEEDFIRDVFRQFDMQVKETPNGVAVSHDSKIFTYQALYNRVSSIAVALRDAGVTLQSVVGIATDHNIDLVAAPLAVLKLGGIYVPLDKRLPNSRLTYMLSDAKPVLTLTTNDVIDRLNDNGCQFLNLEAIITDPSDITEEPFRIKPTDPAYIIYTSGSTGNPKGVVVSRDSLANYCSWASDVYFDSIADRIALYSTLSFDFTATCIFPPLARGCSINIYDGINDPFVIKKIVDQNQSHIIKITPAYMEVLAELVSEDSVIKRLIVGGEDLKSSLAAKVTNRIPTIEIINEYGPTEATVGCMNHTYTSQDNIDGSVPIGEAIDGVQIELLDSTFNRVSDGEIGEIFIFGESVASQYLNNKKANEEHFISLPQFSNSRCYRTGDYARRKNNKLIFVGRRDAQIKIRGNRVEIADVEANFRKLPYISKVHVTYREYLSTKELVAAVVLTDVVSIEQIIAELSAFVPDYMVPRKVLLMERLPMTGNQKIDRHAILNTIEEKNRELTS